MEIKLFAKNMDALSFKEMLLEGICQGKDGLQWSYAAIDGSDTISPMHGRNEAIVLFIVDASQSDCVIFSPVRYHGSIRPDLKTSCKNVGCLIEMLCLSFIDDISSITISV